MDSRTSILKVEARLGFNFVKGLSRNHRAKQTNETVRLLDCIHKINEAFSTLLSWKEIRNSEGVRSEAEKLFHDLGPTSWPEFDRVKGPFPSWLFRPGRPKANENPHRDLYPRPLCFSRPIDNTLLTQHFYALICLKVASYSKNHGWKQSLPAKPPNGVDLHNYTVLESDSEADIHAHGSAQHAWDRHNNHEDNYEASNKSTSGTSDLSSLSPTPELQESMSMRPIVPVACIVPKQLPMGNTQAKLAPQTGEDAAAPRSPGTMAQYQKQYTTSAKDRRDASKSSAKQYLEAPPQPGSSIRRPNLHSVKRVAADVGKEEAPKKHKQVHMQKDIQSISPAINTQGPRQQLGTQGRSTVALPLSSSLLAQFGTADNHNPTQNRSAALDHNNVIKTTSFGIHQNQLNEGSNVETRQGADVSDSPLASSTMNIFEDPRSSQKPIQLPKTRRDVLNDPATIVLEAAGDAALSGDTVMVQDSVRVQSIQSVDPLEPRDFQADSHAEVDFNVGQPRSALQDSELLETETLQVANSTQLTVTEIHESGLQDLVDKLETTTSATGKDNDPLRSVFFKLYLDEEADPLEPQCCVKLTGLTTRDELFKMMDEDLGDDLDTGDKIVAVRVKRADGEVILGLNVRTMPIKRVGQQDMWEELISTLLEHGAGEEGLRGYVKVKKSIDAK